MLELVVVVPGVLCKSGVAKAPFAVAESLPVALTRDRLRSVSVGLISRPWQGEGLERDIGEFETSSTHAGILVYVRSWSKVSFTAYKSYCDTPSPHLGDRYRVTHTPYTEMSISDLVSAIPIDVLQARHLSELAASSGLTLNHRVHSSTRPLRENPPTVRRHWHHQHSTRHRIGAADSPAPMALLNLFLMAPWALAAVAVGALAAFYYLYPYLATYQHLRDIPAPFPAQFTNLWLLSVCRRGQAVQHRRRGPPAAGARRQNPAQPRQHRRRQCNPDHLRPRQRPPQKLLLRHLRLYPERHVQHARSGRPRAQAQGRVAHLLASVGHAVRAVHAEQPEGVCAAMGQPRAQSGQRRVG